MIMSEKGNKFNFFIPATIEKGGKGEGKQIRIKGIASTGDKDLEGHELSMSGFDFTPLLKEGYFNWNHKAKDDPSCIIGRPDVAMVQKNGDLYVEGFLYSSSKKAQEVAKLAETLEKEDPERRLGFSIEGYAPKDLVGSGKITKGVITGIAITHVPINGNTLMQIMKGQAEELFKPIEGTADLIRQEDTVAFKLMQAILNKYLSSPDFSSIGVEPIELYLQKEFNLTDCPDVVNFIFNEVVEKAMTAEGSVTSVEDVEQKKGEHGPFKYLKKSQILSHIMRYTEGDDEKTILLYKNYFKKLNIDSMTEQDIEKALKVLQIIEKGQKEEEMVTTTTTEMPEQKEGIEKGLEKRIREKISQGEDREEIIKSLSESEGYTKAEITSTLSKILSAYGEQKDGGKITKDPTPIESLEKSFSDRLEEGFKGFEKKLTPVSQMGERLDLLQKGLKDLDEKIKTFESQPLGRKSITVQNDQVRNRFPEQQEIKKGTNVYSLSNPDDRESLVNRMFARVESLSQEQRKDTTLEKGIQDLEISKFVSPAVINRLREMDIIVVQ